MSRGGESVLLAGLVFLLGCGLTAFGLLSPTMYDIGIVVIIIGLVGVAVRSVDVLRWLRG
ncbi:MAG TPA: hypothetical protein VGH43_04990 [Jatrophihabitans sp.]